MQNREQAHLEATVIMVLWCIHTVVLSMCVCVCVCVCVLQQTVNLMACSHCGCKHRRYPVTEVSPCAARYCAKCNVRHAVKEASTLWKHTIIPKHCIYHPLKLYLHWC